MVPKLREEVPKKVSSNSCLGAAVYTSLQPTVATTPQIPGEIQEEFGRCAKAPNT